MRRVYIKPEFRGTLIGVTVILVMLLSVLGLQADRHVERPHAEMPAAYHNRP